MKNRGFSLYTSRKSFITMTCVIEIIILIISIIFSGSVRMFHISNIIVGCFTISMMALIINEMAYNGIYLRTHFIKDISNYETDINTLSKIMSNIAAISTDSEKCMESFIEYKYISIDDYICYSDEDIPYFVNKAIKGVSNRYSYKVKQLGLNRILYIDMYDINKKVAIYLTNLDNKQIISFQKLKESQRLGFKNTESTSEYKVEFYNPCSKLESIQLWLVLLLVCLTVPPIVMQTRGWILKSSIAAVLAIIIVLLAFAIIEVRRRITSIRSFPSKFIKTVIVDNEEKNEVIDTVFKSMIDTGYFGDDIEYLRKTFTETHMLYSGSVICKNDKEFKDFIEKSLENVKYKHNINIIIDESGKRSAGISFDTFGMIIKLDRVDDGQVIIWR